MILLVVEPGPPWGPILAWSLAASDPPEAHELRRKLLDLVVRYPGLHLREIARLAELSVPHAQYHLRVLERNALLASQRQGENLRFYPTKASPVGDVPTLSAADRDLLHLLRRPTVFGLLVHLLVEAPLALTDLARRCRVSPSTMSYHLERLLGRGLVRREGETGASLWNLTDPDRVRALLLSHEPPPALVAGFLDAWQRLAP